MHGIIMDAEKTVSLLNRIYKQAKVNFGEENKEVTIPALAALRSAEKVRDFLKETVPYLL